MKDAAIAVKSFIVENGKLLLIKRRQDDIHTPAIWEIPGGRLRVGEDPKDGLKRETQEEVGLEIDVVCPLNVRHFTRDDGQVITMIIFVCRPVSCDVVLSEEHAAAAWVPLAQIGEYLSGYFEEEVAMFQRLGLAGIVE